MIHLALTHAFRAHVFISKDLEDLANSNIFLAQQKRARRGVTIHPWCASWGSQHTLIVRLYDTGKTTKRGYDAVVD